MCSLTKKVMVMAHLEVYMMKCGTSVGDRRKGNVRMEVTK